MYTAYISRAPRMTSPATSALDLAGLIVSGEIDHRTGTDRINLWIRNETDDKRTLLSFDRDQARRVAKAMLKLANREA